MVLGKGMDGYVLLSMIPLLQRLHFLCNFGWFAGFATTDLVCQLLVVTHIEVGFLSIGSTCFKNSVELLNDTFRQWLLDGAKKLVSFADRALIFVFQTIDLNISQSILFNHVIFSMIYSRLS